MRDLGKNGRIIGGSIKFKGRDLTHMDDEALRHIRGSEIAMIYQEPMASLNPAMRIGDQLAEVPMIHEGMAKSEALKLARQIVADVRLPDPDRILRAYPHQLSGGQQQRIVIAMALMSKPALLILDEPTTALDVTVEAGIVDLVKDLGHKYGTSILFISHNLGLILDVCDRLCVMYSGEAVETGNVAEVFDRMRHPYTQALFRSIPLPGADKNTHPLVSIPGNFPLPHERPRGCNFGPRCSYFAAGRCDAEEVPMVPLPGGDRHSSRCIRIDEIDWDAAARRRPTGGKDAGGRGGTADDRPPEILRGLQRSVRRRAEEGRQGQRDAQLRGARGRDTGDRGRIRLRQVHLRQGADGAGNGHLRQDHAL